MTTLQITRQSDVFREEERSALQPLLDEIARLKKERQAVVVAHNYMTPDIYWGAADFTGDSLALAYQAKETAAEVIVMAGVHFMAETAKIVSPQKKVLIPDLLAGCSLAEGITAADIRRLRAQHPGVPVVRLGLDLGRGVDVGDITCTSSNAVAVVESLGVDKVIFTPINTWAAGSPHRPRWR